MFVERHKNRTWRSLYNVVVKAMPLRATSNCNWSHRGSIDLYINSIVSIDGQIVFMSSFFAMRACANNKSMSQSKMYEACTCWWSPMQVKCGLYNFMNIKTLQFFWIIFIVPIWCFKTETRPLILISLDSINTYM